MFEVAIGIIGGAIVAIVITVTVEMQRRPRLRMRIGDAATVTYGEGSPASMAKYLHVDLVNEELPWPFRWMCRNAALQCHGRITFHYFDDGAMCGAADMPIRFSRSPEAIPLQIRGSNFSGVLVDPDRLTPDSRIDLYPGECTPFDIAVRFDSDAECYGWSNLNYLCSPPWRHPDWKLEPGRYLVEATIKSSGAMCRMRFRLFNDGSTNSFRLEEALPADQIRFNQADLFGKRHSEVQVRSRSRFYRTLRDAWLPGVVCTLLGVGLGWWISFKDTQTQIRSLHETGQSLSNQNEMLRDQNTMLQGQTAMLHDQNGTLLSHSAALTRQADTLASILRTVAAARHDAKLALDRQGNITFEGKPILDSKGKLLTDDRGHAITTD